jgi:hypothetical protein
MVAKTWPPFLRIHLLSLDLELSTGPSSAAGIRSDPAPDRCSSAWPVNSTPPIPLDRLLAPTAWRDRFARAHLHILLPVVWVGSF